MKNKNNSNNKSKADTDSKKNTDLKTGNDLKSGNKSKTAVSRQKKPRNSSIEFLRLLLMFLVIILHYNNSDMGEAYKTAEGYNLIVLKIFEVLASYAVNCFVLISGYFMVNSKKVTFKKPLLLLLLVIGYQVVNYVVMCILGYYPFVPTELAKSFFPSNWFVILYLVLYLLAPYINRMLETLDQKEYQKFLLLIICLFSVIPTITEGIRSIYPLITDFLSVGTVSISGSIGGYTIVNFFVMYVIGAYLRKFDIKSTMLKSLICFVVVTLMNVCISKYSNIYTSYSNTIVIAQAVAFFNMFNSMNWGEIKPINFLHV